MQTHIVYPLQTTLISTRGVSWWSSPKKEGLCAHTGAHNTPKTAHVTPKDPTDSAYCCSTT